MNCDKKTMGRLERLVVIDFEASSLSEGSWPVEVGISWIERGELRSWASLIRPDAGWSMDHWSIASAAVHRIPLETLSSASPAKEVADTLITLVAGKRLVSDAPTFERMWLSKLLAAAGHSRKSGIAEYNEITFSIFDGYALDMVYETLERTFVPHRAGPDSARLVKGWLKGAET